MKTLLTLIYGFLSGLNPVVSTVVAILVTIVPVFTWVNAKIHLIIAKIDLLAVHNFEGTLNIAPLGFLDTFVPLSETLTYLTGWLVLLTLCSVIRIIKSFVPAIAT